MQENYQEKITFEMFPRDMRRDISRLEENVFVQIVKNVLP